MRKDTKNNMNCIFFTIFASNEAQNIHINSFAGVIYSIVCFAPIP